MQLNASQGPSIPKSETISGEYCFTYQKKKSDLIFKEEL